MWVRHYLVYDTGASRVLVSWSSGRVYRRYSQYRLRDYYTTSSYTMSPESQHAYHALQSLALYVDSVLKGHATV